jgi:hypothetical protein
MPTPPQPAWTNTAVQWSAPPVGPGEAVIGWPPSPDLQGTGTRLHCGWEHAMDARVGGQGVVLVGQALRPRLGGGHGLLGRRRHRGQCSCSPVLRGVQLCRGRGWGLDKEGSAANRTRDSHVAMGAQQGRHSTGQTFTNRGLHPTEGAQRTVQTRGAPWDIHTGERSNRARTVTPERVRSLPPSHTPKNGDPPSQNSGTRSKEWWHSPPKSQPSLREDEGTVPIMAWGTTAEWCTRADGQARCPHPCASSLGTRTWPGEGKARVGAG